MSSELRALEKPGDLTPSDVTELLDAIHAVGDIGRFGSERGEIDSHAARGTKATLTVSKCDIAQHRPVGPTKAATRVTKGVAR
jgi:hypothetical protein